MKAPPLLLGAGLLFWGWQTGHLLAASALALMAEGSRVSTWRWKLEERDFQRIADLSSVLFLALVAIQFTDDAVGGIFRVLEWMPAVLAPLMLAQLFGRHSSVPLSALFASLRRARGTLLEPQQGVIDLSYPYLFACLLAASVGSESATTFMPIAVALLAWGAWTQRPRGRRASVWLACLLVATGGAIAINAGLYRAQGWAEAWMLRWLHDPILASASPDRAFTAIGMLGRLKLSDRIRLRVDTDTPLASALLLREASYSEYRSGTWRNRRSGFIPIDPQADGHTWLLSSSDEPRGRLTITAPVRRELEVIALPHGTSTLRGDDILGIQRNGLGVVMVDTRPGYLRYTVDYAVAAFDEPPPDDDDLQVPDGYRSALARVSAELAGPLTTDTEKIAAVERFFRDKFTYSLVQRRRPTWSKPLIAFLLEQRNGHCEYFASATTLLLRAIGVPARYAVGYSVSEYSALEGQYVARQRDAHAWVLAYAAGRWRVVDTTPATWHAEEEAASTSLTTLSDLGAWVGYQWSRFRSQEGAFRTVLTSMLPVLVTVLLWRLRHAQRTIVNAPTVKRQAQPQTGADSEFYLVVRRSSRAGNGPLPGETLQAWTRRMRAMQRQLGDSLEPLLALHYRYRFDPRGLSPEERQALRTGAIAQAGE